MQQLLLTISAPSLIQFTIFFPPANSRLQSITAHPVRAGRAKILARVRQSAKGLCHRHRLFIRAAYASADFLCAFGSSGAERLAITGWLEVRIVCRRAKNFFYREKNSVQNVCVSRPPLPRCSLPSTSCAIFFGLWPFMLMCTSAYLFIIVRSTMYFFGMCVYVSAMVADLGAALADFDERARVQSTERTVPLDSRRALANQIRFHNEILEYGDLHFENVFF